MIQHSSSIWHDVEIHRRHKHMSITIQGGRRIFNVHSLHYHCRFLTQFPSFSISYETWTRPVHRLPRKLMYRNLLVFGRVYIDDTNRSLTPSNTSNHTHVILIIYRRVWCSLSANGYIAWTSDMTWTKHFSPNAVHTHLTNKYYHSNCVPNTPNNIEVKMCTLHYIPRFSLSRTIYIIV